MDLKYSKIRNENGEKIATVYIFGIIGYDIIGEEFARELKYLHEQVKINVLDVFINSPGGSVVSGYSIVGALLHAQKKGVKINMLNVGVAYSMGGIILVTGQKRDSYDYGSIMIHDPAFEDRSEEDLSDTDKKFIEVIKNSLATIISNNTGIDLEEVLTLMKTETVYSAKEAKKNKFIDNVIKTGREIDVGNKSNVEKMVAYSNIFNNNFINPKSKKMDKIAKFLGLNPDASEESILNELQKRFDKLDEVDKVKISNKKLTAKVTELTDLLAEGDKVAKKDKAEALINKAKEDGLIPDEDEVVNAWTDNAVENYEKTEKMLKVMKPLSTKSIDNKLKKGDKMDKNKKGAKDLVSQYDELIDDPSKMDEMQNKDPEGFKKIEDAWFAANKEKYAVEIEK